MPTGYTAAIADGITFEQFVLRCARAFGALVALRDEPLDAPIPAHFEANDYYARALDRDQKRLRELLDLSSDERKQKCEQEHQEACRSAQQHRQERQELRTKYEAMLAQVEAWQPPTVEHHDLRRFMRQQITDSIRHDCYETEDPKPVSVDLWYADQVANLERAIEHHRKSHAEEEERVKGRNKWLQSLLESLRSCPLPLT